MLLKDFSLITPILEAELIFKTIETVISPSVIKETLSETGSGEERCLRRAKLTRKLPSGLVVCLVIAMNLWSSDAMGDVGQ
ncbi:transposase domain-containing protein [Nostoc sp. UCD121]|nr:transposase domain-containing protein [Nostoc sp. UCD120]MBC1275255.1 transposase domain-containing protein [Nostoc sp. UCD121]MBC1299783.1 transposase domain-containing protein [Nostoc sp. UCD122]